MQSCPPTPAVPVSSGQPPGSASGISKLPRLESSLKKYSQFQRPPLGSSDMEDNCPRPAKTARFEDADVPEHGSVNLANSIKGNENAHPAGDRQAAAKLKRRSMNILRNLGPSTVRQETMKGKAMASSNTAYRKPVVTTARKPIGGAVSTIAKNPMSSRPGTQNIPSRSVGQRISSSDKPAFSNRAPMARQTSQQAAARPFLRSQNSLMRDRVNEVQTEMQRIQQNLKTVSTEKLDFERRWKLAVEKQRETSETLGRTESNLTNLQIQLNETQADLAKALMTVKSISEENVTLKDQIAASGLEANRYRNLYEDTNESYKRHIVLLEEATKEIKSLKDELQRFELERRKLHNTIQELKGNIRVFCRVRPVLQDNQLCSVTFSDADTKTLEIGRTSEATVQGGKTTGKLSLTQFEFDRVFTPTDSQAIIFDEISQLVQSVIDGYNVCIFAYGQTGSGKTYTMEGPPLSVLNQYPETAGMISLSVKLIFESLEKLHDQGWEYKVYASFIEIYNETVLDLLAKEANTANQKLDIKLSNSTTNDVDVPGLTVTVVNSYNEVSPLLKTAQYNRAVASTKCNDRSSRSHSIFRLRLKGTHERIGATCEGVLNLVDLAGSERVKESQSEGERLKEAVNINKSLSTLGQVILALANKDNYIPYRNSKLTYLLQNSLGGNSKTLMFVNISPEESCLNESLNSLRFATKVNQCHIGTATKNVGAGKSKQL